MHFVFRLLAGMLHVEISWQWTGMNQLSSWIYPLGDSVACQFSIIASSWPKCARHDAVNSTVSRQKLAKSKKCCFHVQQADNRCRREETKRTAHDTWHLGRAACPTCMMTLTDSNLPLGDSSAVHTLYRQGLLYPGSFERSLQRFMQAYYLSLSTSDVMVL